jgi:hypothetical protein
MVKNKIKILRTKWSSLFCRYVNDEEIIGSKARAYPSEAPFRCSTLGYAPGLTHKHKTRLGRLARDKHSSLLRKSVNYGRKKFYSVWHQACKNASLSRRRSQRLNETMEKKEKELSSTRGVGTSVKVWSPSYMHIYNVIWTYVIFSCICKIDLSKCATHKNTRTYTLVYMGVCVWVCVFVCVCLCVCVHYCKQCTFS